MQRDPLTFPRLLELRDKFPDFQRSISNSLTFSGFPDEWTPCQALDRTLSQYLALSLLAKRKL